MLSAYFLCRTNVLLSEHIRHEEIMNYSVTGCIRYLSSFPPLCFVIALQSKLWVNTLLRTTGIRQEIA